MGLRERMEDGDAVRRRARAVQEEMRRTAAESEALRRVLVAAEYVCDEHNLVDMNGVSTAPEGVPALADALEDLPLALRQHYGLHG